MPINATMGLKLPKTLWKDTAEQAKSQGMTTSAFINQVVVAFHDDTDTVLMSAIAHALKTNRPSKMGSPEPIKSTSVSIDVQALQHMHDVAEKLEMSRESVLRILLRHVLACHSDTP